MKRSWGVWNGGDARRPAPGWLGARMTHLITGGAGGVTTMAHVFWARFRRPVVLCGGRKREVDLVGIAGGANQPPSSADIADVASVERLVETVVQSYGGLHGVLHCAGVTDDGLITDKSEETLRGVLRPKWTAGPARSGDQGPEARPFVMFSSTSAAFGNAGRSITRRPRFLDGFAIARDEQVQRAAPAGRPPSTGCSGKMVAWVFRRAARISCVSGSDWCRST